MNQGINIFCQEEEQTEVIIHFIEPTIIFLKIEDLINSFHLTRYYGPNSKISLYINCNNISEVRKIKKIITTKWENYISLNNQICKITEFIPNRYFFSENGVLSFFNSNNSFQNQKEIELFHDITIVNIEALKELNNLDDINKLIFLTKVVLMFMYVFGGYSKNTLSIITEELVVSLGMPFSDRHKFERKYEKIIEQTYLFYQELNEAYIILTADSHYNTSSNNKLMDWKLLLGRRLYKLLSNSHDEHLLFSVMEIIKNQLHINNSTFFFIIFLITSWNRNTSYDDILQT